MKNKEIKRLVKSVLIVNFIIMLIGLVVLLLIEKYSWFFGYLLGSVTADITFIMHANNVSKVGITNTNPTKSSISSSIFRMLISALSLLVAFVVEGIDIYATFVGLVLIKVVIIIVSLIVEKKNNKDMKEATL